MERKDIFLVLNISDLFNEIIENPQFKALNNPHLLGKHGKETIRNICNEFLKIVEVRNKAQIFPVIVDVSDSVAMTNFLHDLCDWAVNKTLFTHRVLKWYTQCKEPIYAFPKNLYDCTIEFNK